jgi:signal transduction histidine kinase
MPAVRVLLLEDNPHDAELVERELRRGGLDFELVRAADRTTYVEALKTRPDLVISDYGLPSFDGLTAFALLRAQQPGTPFILVSGAIGEELAVAAIREGVSDYLLKDRLTRLPNAAFAALEQVRLRREKEQLEERLLRADRLESLGQLAAGVAHDLNNILTPIMMAADTLGEGAQNADDRALLSTISTCAERGAKVLRQLLAFGRGTSGEKVPVHLAMSVAEIASLIRETFPRGVTLEVRVEAHEARVLGDPTQIQQILMNLCVNARDAMPRGGVLALTLSEQAVEERVTRGHPGTEPGRYALLSVRDTGTGIAPADLERIFDPFFTTKPVDEGTGLGLSSVLGIVKSHGGFIQVDSVPGKGSEFRVYLPLRQNPSGGVSATRGTPDRRAEGGVVLVVDDEPTVRQVIHMGLERFGYRVLEAVDGASGIDRFRADVREIGAVVIDLSMPEVDGLELVRAIRALGSSVPIIAIVGLATSHQVQELRALGVRHLLQKPFGIAELLKPLAGYFAERSPDGPR